MIHRVINFTLNYRHPNPNTTSTYSVDPQNTRPPAERTAGPTTVLCLSAPGGSESPLYQSLGSLPTRPTPFREPPDSVSPDPGDVGPTHLSGGGRLYYSGHSCGSGLGWPVNFPSHRPSPTEEGVVPSPVSLGPPVTQGGQGRGSPVRPERVAHI